MQDAQKNASQPFCIRRERHTNWRGSDNNTCASQLFNLHKHVSDKSIWHCGCVGWSPNHPLRPDMWEATRATRYNDFSMHAGFTERWACCPRWDACDHWEIIVPRRSFLHRVWSESRKKFDFGGVGRAGVGCDVAFLQTWEEWEWR